MNEIDFNLVASNPFRTCFPLTPALSLRERENSFPPSSKAKRWIHESSVQQFSNYHIAFPLPRGEGQGEGGHAFSNQGTCAR